MPNNTGDVDENVSNPERPSELPPDAQGAEGTRIPATGLVTRQTFQAKDILAKALSPKPESNLPTEIRRVRRGKFFLSDYEQTQYGSLRRPIFQYYCHGVVVGETVRDEAKAGQWCYAAHNDFDLVPEFQAPSSWPEYTRTPTGWVRADGDRRLEAPEPSPALMKLFEFTQKHKRLT